MMSFLSYPEGENKTSRQQIEADIFFSTCASQTQFWGVILSVLPNTKYSHWSKQYLNKYSKWKWGASLLDVFPACRFLSFSNKGGDEAKPVNIILSAYLNANLEQNYFVVSLTVIKMGVHLCIYFSSLSFWSDGTFAFFLQNAYAIVFPIIQLICKLFLLFHLVFLCLVSLFISIHLMLIIVLHMLSSFDLGYHMADNSIISTCYAFHCSHMDISSISRSEFRSLYSLWWLSDILWPKRCFFLEDESRK